ncbi:MAG: type II secretion system major pseudopilin GspG [Planctomycetota bacterium]|jgi:general secretion pathway protein G
MKGRKKEGFTLVEMMVVITIIAVLAGGVALVYWGHIRQAKHTKARADLTDLETALSMYRLRTGKYPETLEELTKPMEGDDEGLVKEEIPKDPWGNDYVYQRMEGKFVLMSFGADGAEGGEGENEDVTARAKKKDESR